MNNYHLVNDDGDWKLKKENAGRTSINLDGLNKEEAIKKSATHLANTGSSLKIHKVDGKIQEERTYPRSADPKKSKG
ncbi:MAG: DUF2188 domain-containing protein [Chitinophagaceae bacterium]|nr:MAG: DUF2188 domain-containing protein [Chitinophagaceae bacterium]